MDPVENINPWERSKDPAGKHEPKQSRMGQRFWKSETGPVSMSTLERNGGNAEDKQWYRGRNK